MMTTEGCIKIVNFMIPRIWVLLQGCIHQSHALKMHFFFKSLFLLPGIYKTNYVHSNNDQGKVYQNCKCHDLGARVRVLGCGHIRHIMKIHYFFKNNSIISNRLSLENFFSKSTAAILTTTQSWIIENHVYLYKEGDGFSRGETYDTVIRTIRPMGLNAHLSFNDCTLTSCQKGSYLHINSLIINQIKINNGRRTAI